MRLRRSYTAPGSDSLLASSLRPGRPLLWGMLGLGAIVGLASLGGLAGERDDGPLGGLPAGLWDQLQSPLALALLVAAAAVVGMYAVRHIVLWVRAVTPGPIVVAPLENPAELDLPVRELAIQFQQHLSRVHLAALNEVPGASPSVEFVQLLKSTELDVKKPFGFVGGVLGVIAPSHAYEVKVTLLGRTDAPSCGVAVELLMLPRRVTTVRRYWEDSWERAIERAAHGVAAQVLPRTRKCEDPPWTAWHRRRLPEALFDHYQLARQRLEERRFEEALAHYYAALRLDPGNRNIGFELGVAQEKLGLWLDALLTYHRLFTAEPRPRRGPLLPGRRIRSRAELLARYRFMTLLGFGERLARQWITTGDGPGRNGARRGSSPGWTARDVERQALREHLREAMSERYATLDDECLETLGLQPPADEPDGAGKSGAEPKPEERRRRFVTHSLRVMLAQPRWGERGLVARRNQEGTLLLLFHLFAEHEARRLLHDCRFQSLRRFHTGITVTSILIAQVWARRRRQRVQGKADPVFSHAELFGPRLAARLRRSRSYTDHYNAACTFALVALPLTAAGPHLNRKDLERIALPVVGELRRAVAAAESGTMAGRWDWIVSEDPDLAGLRDTRAFRAFESERFPSARPAPQRPSDVHHLELARHSARLVAVAARRFEQEWHGRAQRAEDDAEVDIHEIQDWWEEEVGAWKLVERFTVDFRHWHMRLAVIHHMQAFALRHGQKPFQIAHPRYANDPLEVDKGTLDEVSHRHVDSAGRRIERLREVLAGSPEILDDVRPEESWQRRLRALDRRGQTLEPDELRRLCHAREAVWAGLATWFETAVGNAEEVEGAAADLFDAVGELPPPEPAPDVLRDLEQPARRVEKRVKGR